MVVGMKKEPTVTVKGDPNKLSIRELKALVKKLKGKRK
jgi:hypothetical protein